MAQQTATRLALSPTAHAEAQRAKELQNVQVSPWCLSTTKRVCDIVCSVALLLPLLPVMLTVAILVKLTSPGPVLFRQARVGKDGTRFNILKFRSMLNGDNHSPRPSTVPRSSNSGGSADTKWNGNGRAITVAADCRITPIGRVLRKWKLDELPQFINVVRGDMSVVGPRPYLPEFYAWVEGDGLNVIAMRPGITGKATLEYHHEDYLLSSVPEGQLEKYYFTHVLPRKLQMDMEYAGHATFRSDASIIWRTALVLLQPMKQIPVDSERQSESGIHERRIA